MLSWHAEHPEKQLIGTRSLGAGGLHPLWLSAPSLQYSGMSWGLLKTPSHSFSGKSLGHGAHGSPGFAVTEEQAVSSLKELPAFVCKGKARITFTDSEGSS